MQQFTVPQFIDVEDKIIGPITIRQFVILMAGFILIAVCYKIFDFSLFVVSALFIFAVSGVFAFLKINGRPFHFFVLNLVQTFKRPKLRVWSNLDRQFDEGITIDVSGAKNRKKAVAADVLYQPSQSRLTELSLVVDTKGIYRGFDDSDNMDISKVGKSGMAAEIPGVKDIEIF